MPPIPLCCEALHGIGTLDPLRLHFVFIRKGDRVFYTIEASRVELHFQIKARDTLRCMNLPQNPKLQALRIQWA